jgi:hypothetical protein
MKNKNNAKRRKHLFIFKFKFKFVFRLMTEICIATIIIGKLHTKEFKFDNGITVHNINHRYEKTLPTYLYDNG